MPGHARHCPDVPVEGGKMVYVPRVQTVITKITNICDIVEMHCHLTACSFTVAAVVVSNSREC